MCPPHLIPKLYAEILVPSALALGGGPSAGPLPYRVSTLINMAPVRSLACPLLRSKSLIQKRALTRPCPHPDLRLQPPELRAVPVCLQVTPACSVLL